MEINEAKVARNEDKSVRHALARSTDGRRRKRRKIGSTNSFAIATPEDSLSDSNDEEQTNHSSIHIDSVMRSEAPSSSALLPSIRSHSPSPTHTSELSLTREPRPTEQIKPSAAIGGALARNPDGTVVAPRVVVRKRKKFGQTV